MEVIDQQVINDNKEIYAKIQRELTAAEFEILIATAWFTDEDLYQIVSDKLNQGVHVEIIIADNQENEKLDFDALITKGAQVYKIKNSGYGIMNQKFCVIDRRIALHGSYNWSVNAKKNNQESIISTNHQETIQSLIRNFTMLHNRMQQDSDGMVQTAAINGYDNVELKEIPVQIPISVGSAFEKVLDAMVEAEVGSFDRKLLHAQGFERSKANSGDHQVLFKSFDTVYSLFINDIDVVDDKKKRLQAKIEEQKIKTQESLNQSCDLEITHLEKDQNLKINSLETQQSNLLADIDINLKSIEEVRQDKIPPIEKDAEEIDDEIKNRQRDFITPQVKWYEFIPTAIFNAALLVYLFIFYSSAAYILLFSVADAKEAEAQNMPIAIPQIFNAHAISKAVEKGWVAVLFICLFVFIPLSFAMADRFIKSKWVTQVLFWFGIIFLDGAVAYKVTESIYEVNYARGNVNIPWKLDMAFTDTNFYLVFVFGTIGLLMFKYALKKQIELFEDRNPDILAQRNRLHIQQLKEEKTSKLEKIAILKENITSLDKAIIQFRGQLTLIRQELQQLPSRVNQAVQHKRSQLVKDLETIDKIASIYIVHIQSDHVPISVDSLKDRINVFLEGWNDFLYQEYSILKATVKTREAAEVALTWQKEKLHLNKVDKRVKFNTGE